MKSYNFAHQLVRTITILLISCIIHFSTAISTTTFAAGEVTCTFNGEVCVMGFNSCSDGSTIPTCPGYPLNDCCRSSYANSGVCPTTIACTSPVTTPTTAPTSGITNPTPPNQTPAVCTLDINPTQITANATSPLNGAFSIYSPSNCSWNAISNQSWITITNGTNGTGNRNVNFTLSINNGAQRTGSIVITQTNNTKIYNITQRSGNINIGTECPSSYECITSNNCQTSNGDFSKSCTTTSGSTGNCCQASGNIPNPGTCTSSNGCFGCDYNSTNQCSYSGDVSRNNCTNGYIPDSSQCDLLSNTNSYICNGTLLPCIPRGQGSYSKCTNNGCAYCNPSEPDCVPHSECTTTCAVIKVEDEVFFYDLCLNIPKNDPAHEKCRKCVNPSGKLDQYGRDIIDPNNAGTYTAVGCIPTSTIGVTTSLIQIAVGLAGGFALLLIVYGAFQLSLAAGDPKGAQAGKDTISGAVIGLLVILFSVVILNIIGVDILRLPGF
jgi:hypothetical protein